MSGVEDWCVFQKLSPGKPLTHQLLLEPSANLISANSQYAVFAYANREMVTFTGFREIAEWAKGGEIANKHVFEMESSKEVSHVVISPSGCITAIAAQCDLLLLSTKAILDSQNPKPLCKFVLPEPVHYLEISPEDKTLVLTKAGTLSIVANGEKTEVKIEQVQSCCFSISGKEIVVATPGRFSLLEVSGLREIYAGNTSLRCQVIGIRQISADAWAFLAIDPDFNTVCYVFSHSFFTGTSFEDAELYFEGDEGNLNPMRTPPNYDMKQLHSAFIVSIRERELFLFASSVSTTIECVTFDPATGAYKRFDTETSKIKAQLGHMTIEGRRFDILCRGLAVCRAPWDNAPRFLTHYIDDDYDLPRQPLVLGVGMNGDLVSFISIDYREQFQQVETVTDARAFSAIQNPSAEPAISSLSLSFGGKPEEEKKERGTALFTSTKSVFTYEETKTTITKGKVADMFPSSSAPKPEEKKGKPEESKSVLHSTSPKPQAPAKPAVEESKAQVPKLAEDPEIELRTYFSMQLEDMKMRISSLQQMLQDQSLSAESCATLTRQIRDLQTWVDRDKGELEQLNGPLQKLQLEEADNKLEFEALKKMRNDGLLKKTDNLLPIKMRKRLKMMETRVVLLQEYEQCFKTIAALHSARMEALFPAATSAAVSRLSTGPRALKRFTGPIKPAETPAVSMQLAKTTLVRATESILNKVYSLEAKLQLFQEQTRPKRQEKRFDFSEVEAVELDEEEGQESVESLYTAEEAQSDFVAALSRLSQEKSTDGGRLRTPQKLMQLERMTESAGKMAVKPVSPLRIDFSSGASPPASLASKIQQYEATIRQFANQRKGAQGGAEAPATVENPPESKFGAGPLQVKPAETRPLTTAAVPASGNSEGKPAVTTTPGSAKLGAKVSEAASTIIPAATSNVNPAATSTATAVKSGIEPAKPSVAATKPGTVSSFFVNPPTTATGSGEQKTVFGTPVSTAPAFDPKPVGDSTPMFSGFPAAQSNPTSGSFGTSGFGVQSSFSKPSIPTNFGGFATSAAQGGGFKGVMQQAGSSPFAALQSSPQPAFPQSSAAGGNSELFKPRK